MKYSRQAVRATGSSTALKAAILTGVGLWMGGAAPARANPADLFGFGAREASMGNAFTAVADDPFAAYYNVGGLSQLKRTSVSLGLQAGHMAFGSRANCAQDQGVGCSEPFWYSQTGEVTQQQRTYGYDEPHGVHIGIAVPFGKRLTFGMATYLPLDVRWEDGKIAGVGMRLSRVMTTDPYLPDYAMYRNRPQRFAGYSGLSFEVIPGLGIGIGAAILASAELFMDINGQVTLTEGPEDEEGNPTTSVTTKMLTNVTMDLRPSSTIIGGVLWNLGTVTPKLNAWQLGLTYRGASKLPAATYISADIALAAQLSEEQEPFSYGVNVAGIQMNLLDFYTPQQIAFGVSGLLADRVRVAADLTWSNWQKFTPSVATIPADISAPLGLNVNIEDARVLETENYRDTFVPRLGIEGRLGPYMTSSKLKGVDLYLRAGGSFEQNPFPNQTHYNNLLNSDTVKVAGGLGVTTHNPLSAGRDLPMSLDLSMQYHYLLPTEIQKDFDTNEDRQDGAPVGGVYVSQGSVLQGALTLQFGF